MGQGQSRAVVAGAGGFIGQRLISELRAAEYEVITVGRTRQAEIHWDDSAALAAAIDGARLLVNLAGKNVGCRYTDAAREEILSSRVETTRALNVAVSHAQHPPELWLNASTATIYAHSMTQPNTEADGTIGHGFSVDVARHWEQEFFAGEFPQTRRVALRMAIVLGDGPATRKLLAIARWGLGGTQYDGWWPSHRRYRGIGTDASDTVKSVWYRSAGQQRFSWIHIDDVLGAIWHVIGDPKISGPVNLSSPHPVTNQDLMTTLRHVVGRRFGMPVFRWMLEPAMFVLRVEPEMLLKSRWATPTVLESTGYRFLWPQLRPALTDIVKNLGK